MAMNPRLLRPRASGGGFSPRSIAGLELWLDASDQSTLFDADTGGSVVAADGAVGRWMDKSGKGRNFTQGTANNRPTWKASGRNARGTVLFDGSNDRLVGDSTQYASTTAPFTAVFVHIVDSTAGLFPVFLSSATAESDSFRWFNSNAAGYTDYAMGSGAAAFARTRYTSASRGSWRYVLYDFIGSSASTEGSYSARAASAGLTRTTAGPFAGGGNGTSTIASDVGGGNNYKGELSEIVIFSKVLSVAERDTLETYLTYKWAL